MDNDALVSSDSGPANGLLYPLVSRKMRARSRSRTVLITLVMLLGLVLLLDLLMDSLPLVRNILGVNQTRAELPEAAARWEVQGISRYTIEVEGVIPLACAFSARLVVEQETLTAVSLRNMPFDETAPRTPLDPETWDDAGCPYTALLVPEMFTRLEQDLANFNPWEAEVKAVFDPDYGFINRYEHNVGYLDGLLLSAVSECCTRYEVQNFQRMGLSAQE